MTETNAPAGGRLPISVIVVSWCRPDHVRTCLEHLRQLEEPPENVLVVDASPDDRTATVVADFAGVGYLSFPPGAGHMTRARNEGLLHATGEILAFIDDDAYVRPGWSVALREVFRDLSVGAVVGRTLNGHEGEGSEGVDAIGRLLPNGQLTGYFAADPGSMIEVDHGIGANMSFRRDVLRRLGGFRDDFRGIGGLREDTDMFLRVKALGYRVIFTPYALVDHVGAPHVRGRRFDYRYAFWARRNHALLLARNFGIGSSTFRRWMSDELRRTAAMPHRSRARRLAHAAIGFAGVVVGAMVAVREARWSPRDPVRRDDVGDHVAQRLLPLRDARSA